MRREKRMPLGWMEDDVAVVAEYQANLQRERRGEEKEKMVTDCNKE